jgi:4-amino-4-deoxy-L-arabinose transferase-like glycosyltransferase
MFPTKTPSLRQATFFIVGLTLLRILYLFVVPLPLSGDEAQYWVWAQHPAAGYFSKPPFLAWAIASTTWMNDGAAWVRLGSPLAQGGTAYCLLLLGRQMGGDRVGAWAGLLYVSLPAVFLSSLLASTDVYLLFFSALTWLLLVKKKELSGGIAFGLGLLSKYAAVFLLPMFVVIARRKVLWLFIPALVLLVPNIFWNLTHGGSTWHHTGENIRGGGLTFSLKHLWEFVSGQVLMGGLVTVLLGVAVWKRGWRLAEDYRNALLLSLLPFGLITAQAVLSRANPNWAAVGYLGAVLLVAIVGVGRGWESWLRRAVLVHTSVAILALSIPWWSWALPWKRDPLRRLVGMESLTEQFLTLRERECPTCRILTRDRMQTALLLYYGRDNIGLDDIAVYDPASVPTHHFSLCCNVRQRHEGDFLTFSREDMGSMKDYFSVIQKLDTLQTTTHPGRTLSITVYRVSNWQE